MEGMDYEEIEEILDSLFPKDDGSFVANEWKEKLDDGSWQDENEISAVEG